MATSLADSVLVTESVRPGFQLQFSPPVHWELGAASLEFAVFSSGKWVMIALTSWGLWEDLTEEIHIKCQGPSRRRQ